MTPLPLLPLRRLAACALALLGAAVWPAPGQAQTGAHDTVLQARDALRSKDVARLATLSATATAARHPLAMWVDYWALNVRLDDARQEEVTAFYRRWPDSYVEDRLRNDWLLVLGKRRDWANFRAEYPQFLMNDDREVRCHALLARHADGDDVGPAGRDAWLAQREPDEGCAQLAEALFAARRLGEDDVMLKARLAVEANRPRVARQAGARRTTRWRAGRSPRRPRAAPTRRRGRPRRRPRRRGGGPAPRGS